MRYLQKLPNTYKISWVNDGSDIIKCIYKLRKNIFKIVYKDGWYWNTTLWYGGCSKWWRETKNETKFVYLKVGARATLHRIDGPAAYSINKKQNVMLNDSWYLHGKSYSKEDYILHNPLYDKILKKEITVESLDYLLI